MTAAHDHTPGGPTGGTEIPLRGVVTLLIDLVLPVALYYGLRAGGVAQLAALLISGAPPAVRIAFTFARTHRVDAIGALVLAAVALGVIGLLIGGNTRTLLIRDALFGFPFALWMLASLRAKRPLTYRVAVELLPGRERAFECAWADEPTFRRIWHRLTVIALHRTGALRRIFATPR